MKSIYFLILLLVFTNFSIGQKSENYIQYHQNCRKAEQYFIQSDYIKCINLYDSIFNQFDFLFPRDCYLAAQIAKKAGNDSLAVIFLMKGVPFGLNAELIFSLDSIHTISKISKSKYWQLYLNEYDSLRNLYITRIDWKLKSKLIEIVKEDQSWRVRNNKWFNRTFRHGLEKKFEIVNYNHTLFLDSVFKTKGYPGIWLIGVGDTSKPYFNNILNLNEFSFILLYHEDSALVKYGNYLKSEIQNGHIHPRVYAMIYDFSDRFLVKNEKDQKMYYNLWWQANNFTKEEFDVHCNEIGCPTNEHLKQLALKCGNEIEMFWFPFR